MVRIGQVGRAGLLVLVLVMLGAACSAPSPEPVAGPAASAAEKELMALEALRAKVEQDKAKVGNLRVVSTRYRHETQESGWSRPHLDLVMENGTTLAVSGFTLVAELRSPGRDEPWFRQELQVPVAGGLAPGASHETTLTPSPDSPWALAQAPTDARMFVEVLTVLAADGQTYLGAGSFSKQAARRLEALKAGKG